MKIFLSAVSRELGSYREELTRPLLRKKIEVRVQEYFRPGTATLLEMLRDYIRECDRVILLVGDRCGDFPTDDHVKAIGSVAEFDRYRIATGQTRASYTQWEFFFAREFGKPIQVFFTGKDFKPDKPNPESADLQARQQACRDWIKYLGHVRSAISTPAQLIEDVLVDDLATHTGVRPNNLPFHSLGELFKGRMTDLDRLKPSLERTKIGHATAIIQSQAVHGLGGVGKTRLAVEYAWQHTTDYTALLFVGADSPENLRRNLAALVAPAVLNLPEHDLPHEDVRMAAAVRWLEQHPGWLLILDNVDTLEAAREVQKTLPQFRHGRVLITSRRSQWSAEVEPLELDKLSLADSADFLLERTAKQRRLAATDRADAESLARELDGLALALEQAGAYIAQRHCSIAEYLAQWRAHDHAVQEWYDDTVMNYPRSVATTWETTLEQLGPAEVALLRMFAWFAPNPIPLFVLDGEEAPKIWREAAASFARERGIESEVAGTPFDALVNLNNFGMAKLTDQNEGIIHRVVQEILRSRVSEDRQKMWSEFALRLINNTAPRHPDDVRTWPEWDRLIPHVIASIEFGVQQGVLHWVAPLLNQVGILYTAKALCADAELVYRRALMIIEKIDGPNHFAMASCLSNLAHLMKDTDRLDEAESLNRRAMSIAENAPDITAGQLATCINNLAKVLNANNRMEEAEELYRRSIALLERSSVSDHLNISVPLNNLAELLTEKGRLEEAGQLTRRSLQIEQNRVGASQPSVGVRLSMLADIQRRTNRIGEAESNYREALAIDQKYYVPDHPSVATRLSNLALLLNATDRSLEAQPLMKRALEILVNKFGIQHRNSKQVAKNYARILISLGFSSENAAREIQLIVGGGVRVRIEGEEGNEPRTTSQAS